MTWSTLHHQNVLQLIGATMAEGRFMMVSEWMENGNIKVFVKANPTVNRVKLVGFLFEVIIFGCH